MEAFWSTFVLPAAEEQSQARPLLLNKNGDYSYFRKYMETRPDGQPGKIELQRIFSDNLSFRDSGSEPGSTAAAWSRVPWPARLTGASANQAGKE